MVHKLLWLSTSASSGSGERKAPLKFKIWYISSWKRTYPHPRHVRTFEDDFPDETRERWDMFFPSLEGSLIFGNFMEKSFVISTDRADRVSSTISTWFARFLNHRRYPTNLRSVKWVYGAQTRSSKLEFLKVGKMNDFHPSTKFTFFWVKKVRRLPMLNQTNSHMTYPP